MTYVGKSHVGATDEEMKAKNPEENQAERNQPEGAEKDQAENEGGEYDEKKDATNQKNNSSEGETGAENGVDEFGLPKLPTGDPQTDKEVKYLRTLVRQEQGHGQWKKQALNLISLVILIVRSLARSSMLGFEMKKCSVADWVVSAVFIILMAIMVKVATALSARE
jgi:hypothetical protein